MVALPDWAASLSAASSAPSSEGVTAVSGASEVAAGALGAAQIRQHQPPQGSREPNFAVLEHAQVAPRPVLDRDPPHAAQPCGSVRDACVVLVVLKYIPD
mgnify:CR=1 FL=1